MVASIGTDLKRAMTREEALAVVDGRVDQLLDGVLYGPGTATVVAAAPPRTVIASSGARPRLLLLAEAAATIGIDAAAAIFAASGLSFSPSCVKLLPRFNMALPANAAHPAEIPAASSFMVAFVEAESSSTSPAESSLIAPPEFATVSAPVPATCISA